MTEATLFFITLPDCYLSSLEEIADCWAWVFVLWRSGRAISDDVDEMLTVMCDKGLTAMNWLGQARFELFGSALIRPFLEVDLEA